MNEEQKPNIDQRLDRLVERHEALSQSIELLTHDVHELQETARQDHARMVQLDLRERKGRQAVLMGIVAYLRALNGENDEGEAR